jgi:hypothetical protein
MCIEIIVQLQTILQRFTACVCGGGSICVHGKRRTTCRECSNAGSTAATGKRKRNDDDEEGDDSHGAGTTGAPINAPQRTTMSRYPQQQGDLSSEHIIIIDLTAGTDDDEEGDGAGTTPLEK